jgi:hypothetical protein
VPSRPSAPERLPSPLTVRAACRNALGTPMSRSLPHDPAGHGRPDELPVAIEATRTCAHRRPPATPSATQRCRFALGNALLDTSIATWNAKCLQDTVRPISYIRWRYKGTKTKGWPGPGRGIGDVDGASWDPPGTVPSRGGQRGLHQLRRRRRPGGLVAALWRHPLRGRRPQGPHPGPPGRHGRVGQDGDLLQRHRHRSTTTTTTVAPTTHGGAHHPRRRPPPPRRRPRRPRHQRPPLRHRRRPLANPALTLTSAGRWPLHPSTSKRRPFGVRPPGPTPHDRLRRCRRRP